MYGWQGVAKLPDPLTAHSIIEDSSTQKVHFRSYTNTPSHISQYSLIWPWSCSPASQPLSAEITSVHHNPWLCFLFVCKCVSVCVTFHGTCMKSRRQFSGIGLSWSLLQPLCVLRDWIYIIRLVSLRNKRLQRMSRLMWSILFLTEFSLSWNFPGRLQSLDSKPQVSAYLFLPSAGSMSMCEHTVFL